MFKQIFGIKEYVVENGEGNLKFVTISIPTLLSRLSYAAIGMIVGAKTQIFANVKVLGFKDKRLITAK